MNTASLFHVFRNTPFGRDTLLQSVHFAKKMDLPITLYIPKHQQFVMHFQNRSVTVELDRAFLREPETARTHAESILLENNIKFHLFEPLDFASLDLPNVPISFEYMCCPRSISDLSTKIGMGYIGPKVRQIVQNAEFPVLIPTPVYKTWRRIVAFFGGSENAIRVVRLAARQAKRCHMPLHLFTKAENKSQSEYEDLLSQNGMKDVLEYQVENWLFFEEGRFNRLLYEVPSDALVVLGAYGHGAIKEVLFGSKMEDIQSVLPNNMLIVGPHYRTTEK
jgi:hypothetical protein